MSVTRRIGNAPPASAGAVDDAADDDDADVVVAVDSFADAVRDRSTNSCMCTQYRCLYSDTSFMQRARMLGLHGMVKEDSSSKRKSLVTRYGRMSVTREGGVDAAPDDDAAAAADASEDDEAATEDNAASHPTAIIADVEPFLCSSAKKQWK